jgi:hypothetical protein
MIAYFLSTLICLFLYTSYGFVFTEKLKINASIIDKLLLGLVVCNSLASLVTFFHPVNFIVLVIFLSLGLISMILLRKSFVSICSNLDVRKTVLLHSFPFIIISFILSFSEPQNYDAGLYHIQAIKWIEEYSIIPGLANLHGRFGFNPNIFTLFALTGLNQLFHQYIFSVNFSVLIILTVYFIGRLRVFYLSEFLSGNFIFHFFLFILILGLTNTSSPSPDFLATAIPIYIYAKVLENNKSNCSQKINHYFPIIILACYIITVKLATIPIFILILFLIIRHNSNRQKLLVLFGILVTIIIIWLIRNIILSGYVLYPFPSLDIFSFDWKVPLENVIDEKNGITGWARDPSSNYSKAAEMSLMEWFPHWWERLTFEKKILLLGSITLPIVLLFGRVINKVQIEYHSVAIIITSFLGILFWAVLAPDWRFGESYILTAAMSSFLIPQYRSKFGKSLLVFFNSTWAVFIGYFLGGNVFALIIVFCLLSYYFYPVKSNKRTLFFSALILLFLIGFTKRNILGILNNSKKVVSLKYIIVPPHINPIKQDKFVAYYIDDLLVYVPKEGDRCFDCRIPCTPYPDSTLVLRGYTLESGFQASFKK